MNKEEKQESRRLPGFYIALCCCVIAIGVAGYLTERNSGKTPDEESIAAGESAVLPASDTIVQNPIAQSVPASNTADNVAADEISGSEISAETETKSADNSAADETDEDAPAAVIAAEPAFIVPAAGAILEGYSDKLLYNSALGDWRTHNGVDIAVEEGSSISCIADGTVKEISEDALGMYVTIEHDGGFMSKYRSLSGVEDISEGSEIKSGEVIGIVTASKGESVTEPHIHFELYKDGEVVNPTDYIQY